MTRIIIINHHHHDKHKLSKHLSPQTATRHSPHTRSASNRMKSSALIGVDLVTLTAKRRRLSDTLS